MGQTGTHAAYFYTQELACYILDLDISQQYYTVHDACWQKKLLRARTRTRTSVLAFCIPYYEAAIIWLTRSPLSIKRLAH